MSLAGLFLPSCGLGDASDWSGSARIPIGKGRRHSSATARPPPLGCLATDRVFNSSSLRLAAGEEEAMLSVRITELIGLGPLVGMLPPFFLPVKKAVRMSQFDHYLSRLPLSTRRTLTVGLLRPGEGCPAEELGRLVSRYTDVKSCAWTDHAVQGRWLMGPCVPACRL